MPPKKKRGPQSASGNVSTRSKKKDSPESKEVTNKPAPKKVGRPCKRKNAAKRAAQKKTESEDTMEVEADTLLLEETSAIIQDLTNTVENSEENIEQASMETENVENLETETCEIVEQLENLVVVPLEQTEIIENVQVEHEDTSIIGNQEVVQFEEDAVVETLELYTEEFVPSVETNEVVIEEETSQTSNENEVNLDLLKTEEIEKETKEEKIEKEEDSKEYQMAQLAIEEKFAKVEEELERFQEEPKSLEDAEKELNNENEFKSEIKSDPEAEQINTEKVNEKGKRERKKTAPKKDIPKRKPPKPKQPSNKTSKIIDDENSVRRSSRIKSQNSVQKPKSKGLVKLPKPPEPSDVSENSNTSASNNDSEKSSATASPSLPPDYDNNKPVKVKSRWRRSSELEMNVLTPAAQVMENQLQLAELQKIVEVKSKLKEPDEEVQTRLKQFVHLKENLYLTDRTTCKEAKKMICDCYLSPEEIERGEFGCGEDCLNRLLMIECGNLCPIGDRCTNKKFQKGDFASVEVFKTDKKGLGLRATANIPYGEFILEYVGEVLDHDEFDVRADDYSNDKNLHYYFMALRADAIIDATRKGNISRFINHSCEPNAETQKWTVNGELRIGFFSTRTILAGEEITFDYRFQRYGKEAQKCFCETPSCRGWLGEEPDDEDEEDEEYEEEEEIEDGASEATKEDKSKSENAASEIKSDLSSGTEGATPETVAIEKKVVKREKKKKVVKKPRKDIFEELDLEDEIEMVMATGLKNQAHTLKLSRLIVRAKELQQRQKLMRILRRGELPCRRLFLDYHGLRLMHGYMIDAQQLSKTDKKYEALRLELLQTLATLPIPNKTMLQDSKVLPTVEKWSNKEDLSVDSDSNSPNDQESSEPSQVKEKPKEEEQNPSEEGNTINEKKDEPQPEQEIKLEPEPNYEEEITALAVKLLEEWSSLKEVFKIPKKERIEQMKEHEREANRGYIAGLGLDDEKKLDNRYRGWKRFRITEKVDPNSRNKIVKVDDRFKFDKYERRKMFALQVEQQKEEERRRKQREMWRQHEQQCILLGTDPRLTAPYDPNRGYQCIWNPQMGQWQNYPLPNIPQQPPGYPPNQAIPGLSMPPPNPYIVQTLPALPYQDDISKKMEEDVTQVKFMGPIPPPVKLPPMWKCAKDKYGRPYYYHIKIRKSQWEPPPYSQTQEEQDDSSTLSSSSESSSDSSDTTSDSSDSDEDIDDEKLLQNIRKQLEKQGKLSILKSLPIQVKGTEENDTPSSVEDDKGSVDETELLTKNIEERETSQDTEKEKFNQPPPKKRRAGLVQEIIISPRTEEDRLQFKEDLKRYKQNKEKLKKQKEMILLSKRQIKDKDKKNRAIVKAKMKEMIDSNTESAKRIKETFRSNMATVVVSVLNAYRKPDCQEGRITNTEDFKHLARKLTHFVMLKEMKHIDKIEDLVCTENVKSKAKEYIRKYMSKFGEIYQKRNDEPDF